MSLLNGIAALAKGFVSPVTTYLGKRQDAKVARAEITAKLESAKGTNETNIEMNDQQIEYLMVQLQPGSLKDEYSLFLATSPYLGIFVGTVYMIMTGGDDIVIVAVKDAVKELNAMGVPVGELMLLGFTAGLGIKLSRIR